MTNLYNWCKSNGRCDLIKEWCFEFNKVAMKDVPKNSGKQYWWKCKKGHTYKATIKERIIDGKGCSLCQGGNATNYPEFIIAHMLSKYFPVSTNFKPTWMEGRELDVYLPKCNNTYKGKEFGALVIEYDGAKYHQDIERDLAKNKMCEEKGIHVLRVREEGAIRMPKSADCIVLKSHTDEDILNAAILILKKLGHTPNIDKKRELKTIKKKYQKYMEMLTNSKTRKQ